MDIVEQHKKDFIHNYDKRGFVANVKFFEDTTVVLCLLNKEEMKFMPGNTRRLVKYRFARMTLRGNFKGSILKDFEVFVERKIAKVGFVIAEILEEVAVETLIDKDNPFDRALVEMGALDEIGLDLLED